MQSKLPLISSRIVATVAVASLPVENLSIATPVNSSVEVSEPSPVPIRTRNPETVVSAVSDLVFRKSETEWTTQHEKRFKKLASLVALERQSEVELEELQKLQVLRRRLHHPRAAEEILWEHKQRKITANLIAALSQYVTFHEGEGSARKPSKESKKK